MNTTRNACVVGAAIIVSALHADTLNDDFQSMLTGPVPSGRWLDVDDRAGEPTFTQATANVILTNDAIGNPTHAIQTDDNVGTSGVFTTIGTHRFNSMSVDVRIDRFSQGANGWPIGVGFSGDVGFSDVNENPHAVVYAWPDRRWRLFISTGVDNQPGVDLLINTPQFQLGSWYRIQLDVDAETGLFTAKVFDAAQSILLGERTYQHTNWPQDRGYNAIAFFDGEAAQATVGGQATLDNLMYLTDGEICFADLNGNGQLEFFDVSAFLTAFIDEQATADFNHDGSFNFFDVSAFLVQFNSGCQ